MGSPTEGAPKVKPRKARRRAPSTSWYVYLARCADDTLYCGIARDVAARMAQHDAGAGARYTRGRGPLRVLATQRCRDQGLALRIERAVKRLTRTEKLALAAKPAGLSRIARQARRARATAAARVPASPAP